MYSPVIENPEVKIIKPAHPAAKLPDSPLNPQLLSTSHLARAKDALRRHQNSEVIACATYGSRLRGYADMAADNDVIFLMRRQNSQFLGIGPAEGPRNFEEMTVENERLSRLVAQELGWKISVSTIDEFKLITGIMLNNPYSFAMVQSLAKTSKYVREHILPLQETYFNSTAAAQRAMDVARTQINKLRETPESLVYRQERSYLTGMWHILRAVEYVNERRRSSVPVPNHTMSSLISAVASTNYRECPVLQDEQLFLPYQIRIAREPFANPEPLQETYIALLEDLYRQCFRVIQGSAALNAMILPTQEQQAREILVMLQRNQPDLDND